MATEAEKLTLRGKLEKYEGLIEHMYLDTKGYVTVGVGHLLSTLTEAQALNFTKKKDSKKATKEEIKTDYDTVKKQTKGQFASSYKKHTKLKLTKIEADKLTNKHIESFEKELKKVFGSEAFEGYPSDVRLALFDMIFNLGMTNLRKKFPTFVKHVKAKKWSDAATESKRTDVSSERNKYVKDLFDKVATAATAATATKK